MLEEKPFDPLWEEDNVLICVTLPAPSGQRGCYTVMNWCRRGGDKLDVQRIAEKLAPSRAEALAAARQFCEQKAVPVLYDANFHELDFSQPEAVIATATEGVGRPG
ncbi:MAG: hypothetical protein QUV20_10245 [Oceanibaculum nanhaiense]|uniref:hypothetical protein n=1 Tax=Oceanibaculum nanhaiense TaxID=1909734 RepID=UPI0025A42C36|nr:hypothetical protein [Oceanibaculum nanhaiense]MDM7946696.1 hypothetical protein [Oceanibaculum nanhaiense]